MEVAGAVATFTHSGDKYGINYTKCLRDRDNKGFIKVVEAKPYGETC
jgi:hypothetical protein